MFKIYARYVPTVIHIHKTNLDLIWHFYISRTNMWWIICFPISSSKWVLAQFTISHLGTLFAYIYVYIYMHFIYIGRIWKRTAYYVLPVADIKPITWARQTKVYVYIEIHPPRSKFSRDAVCHFRRNCLEKSAQQICSDNICLRFTESEFF